MKSTGPLRVLCAANLPSNRLNMHPNDGADLGMMTTRHSVGMEGGAQAEIHLLNDCPKDSLQMNLEFWERIGKPEKAILRYDGERLHIDPA